MRRLAEGTPELTAEVGARKAGLACQVGDVERLRIAGIDQIPGPQQVTLRRNETHPDQYRATLTERPSQRRAVSPCQPASSSGMTDS